MAFHSLYGKKFGFDETGSPIFDEGAKAATSVGTGGTGTATINKTSGKITTPTGITTAAGATHVITLTNSKIKATDIVLATVGKGTATTGTPTVADVTPGAGSVVITIQNIHASAAVNGSIAVGFLVLKQ